MKVLLIGSRGQLGHELSFSKPAEIDLHAVGVDVLDITDAAQVMRNIGDLQPDVVINAAAYTAVDKAETDRDTAFLVNASGPGNIARACRSTGCRCIHVSTDFVFDGASPLPYLPEDAPHPLNVYGESKYQGEKRVVEETNGQALILRTAWVYSAHGNNFVKTMLGLMRNRERLIVIYDQVGSPTWARTLATTIWTAVVSLPQAKGVYHWTDAGVASWYDFAVAIQSEALTLGLLDRAIPVMPIRTSQYPTPATRPAFTVLDCSSTWNDFAISPVHWRVCLKEMLREMVQEKHT
ncbi:dTDP-4-dehydrorhamnose reductase [Desulfocastanea catecholica]